ncbi:MAG: thiamine biosynthesis lipoprotein [Verrucomicrobiales bacterium]|jgi:thiamine biosynthesis lipoprotein
MQTLAATAALALLITGSPASDLTRHEFESPQMGTLFKVILYAPDADSAKSAADAAFELAGKLNASFSDYEADSELRQLVAKGEATVSLELFDILTVAKKISDATDGAFDVTTGAHSRNWRKAKITGELPSKEQLRIAKTASGWKKLILDQETRQVTLPPGMQLDLGGIAKGYAADAMRALLKKNGYPIASIAAGGDIAVGDPPPGREGWRIAIAQDGLQQELTVELANQAVSTSGKAEQRITITGKTYSHIVDPKTGLGLEGSIPVSVIAKSAIQTDAFATAFNVLGREKSAPIAAKLSLRIIWGE